MHVKEKAGLEWPTSIWVILHSFVHQLGEIVLPMESGCVDDQQVQTVSAIVSSTLLVGTHITEFVDELLDTSLDIRTPSIVELLIYLMLKELASHMVIPDSTYGHWLQVIEKMRIVHAAVHVMVV
jgi:hypothetical protein